MIRATDLGPCPFCGGAIGASINERGDPTGVVHSMPMCRRFIELEAHEFISAVRRELEQQGAN